MYTKYGERAAFVTIYLKEAHPEDEWQLDDNEEESVCYEQPQTLADRVEIAKDFVERFQYPIPLLVDDVDNAAMHAYAGWPERLYVIDEKGVIVYKGKPGPFGYHPEEVATWLEGRFP